MTTGVYYRVSTEEQSMDMQRVAVQRWLEHNPQPDKVREYTDHGLSGSTARRPGFRRLLADAEANRLTGIVVYKLDRLTRDARTAIKTILRFDELGIRFTSVSQPMFSHGTPFRHALIAIFAELAQMEREMIIERVNAGLAAARARGQRLGPPVKLTPEVVARILDLRVQGLTYKAIAEDVGLSSRTVRRALLNAKTVEVA